jgi:hypothetical protein
MKKKVKGNAGWKTLTVHSVASEKVEHEGNTEKENNGNVFFK